MATKEEIELNEIINQIYDLDLNQKEKNNKKENELDNLVKELNKLDIDKKDDSEKSEKGLETEKNKKTKGKLCSIEGFNYEKKIYNILKNTTIEDKPFNTQEEEDLAGSGHGNDIECKYKDKVIGIEVKKCNAPDWIQSSIKLVDNKWKPTSKGNKPLVSQDIFEKILGDVNLYEGQKPPFFEKDLTHKEWLEIKEKTNVWNDYYKNIPNNTIKELYKEKGCYYIQISEYGLYHLGEDICNFGVPEFLIDQELRIRIKIHTRKDKKGKCRMSVTAACKPKNIKTLEKSKYSLDNEKKLPNNLIYKKINQ